MFNPNDYKSWVFTKRAVPAVIIFYLFIISIMVGMAQQSIVEGLKAKNIDFDYSVAVRHYRYPQILPTLQRQQAAALDRATEARDNGRMDLERGEREIAIRIQNFNSEYRLLAGLAGCPVAAAQAPQADPTATLTAAESVLSCAEASENSANPGLAARIQRVRGAAFQLQETMDRLAALRLRLGTITATATSLTEKHNAMNRQIEQAGRSSDVMAVLEVFRGKWPLAALFISMPPALMGIVISFTGGLFGALLVTLILLVYPGQTATMTASTAYWERLFVGGLVALGVFVVLFSGVAVLNGSNGAAISQNVMAYAAIGILAGMFSDRAAAWLAAQPIFTGARPGDQPQRAGQQ